MGYYEDAVVCKNGHPINGMARYSPDPEAKFCSQCGAENLSDYRIAEKFWRSVGEVAARP